MGVQGRQIPEPGIDQNCPSYGGNTSNVIVCPDKYQVVLVRVFNGLVRDQNSVEAHVFTLPESNDSPHDDETSARHAEFT